MIEIRRIKMGCYNSTIINTPVNEVWNTVRDFHDLSWAKGVVEKVDILNDIPGTQIGTRRQLNGAIQETLLGLDDNKMLIRYSIDDGPDAISNKNVSGYIGEVQLLPVTDTDSTFVLWTSTWEDSGGGVASFCNPIYKALLDAMKNHFA